MDLSADQRTLLSGLAATILTRMTALATYCFLYGVFVPLFCVSVVITRKKRSTILAQKLLFGATVVSLVLATTNVGNEMAGLFIILREALVGPEGVPLEARPQILNKKLVVKQVIAVWADYLPALLIGDGIVIWRTWAFCQEKRWLVVFPCLLWLATLGTALVFGIPVSTRVSTGFEPYAHGGSSNYLINASFAISAATNLAAVIIFSWRLWDLRRFLPKALYGTPVQKSISIMIESGILYFLIQLSCVVLCFWSPTFGSVSWYLVYLFLGAYAMVSAMYPTIMILLIKMNRLPSEVVLVNAMNTYV